MLLTRSVFLSRLWLFGLGVAAASLGVTNCVSSPDPVPGLQPQAQALSPARVLAVTPFLLPDPSRPGAAIDTVTWETQKLGPMIEKNVEGAFRDQPGFKGSSFNLVRKLVMDAKVLVAENRRIPENQVFTPLDTLTSEAQKISSLFRNSSSLGSNFSQNCLRRSSFLNFYFECLRVQKNWGEGLASLSSQVLNADTALLVFVTDLRKSVDKGAYSSHIGLAVFLVDTNNGQVFWAREKHKSTENPPTELRFPDWEPLVADVLGEPFWQDFPTRVSRLQSTPTPK